MSEDFDDWYVRTHASIAPALSAWCGDAGRAAEALDEAFVRAYERWNRVCTLDSPEGWIWATASNLVRTGHRKRRREAQILARIGTDGSDAEDERADVDLARAIVALPARQRTAVTLHYVADLRVADVAQMMGIAEGTVAATLHRARANLAEILRPSDNPLAQTDGANP